jgi:AraC-like DNA-binding protein
MEILSDVLRAVRLTGAVFFDVEATSPWVAESPSTADIAAAVMPEAEHVCCFHVVLSGGCWAWLKDDPDPDLRMEEGDVLLLPKPSRHGMASERGLAGKLDLAIYYRPKDRPLPFLLQPDGGGTERAHFACGYLGCDTRPFNPLLEALPPLIHARGLAAGTGWMGQLIALALGETRAQRAGSEIVLARLSELLFVEVLRSHIDSLPADSRGWLAGLRDRHIGAALRALHARPADPWTLEGLAREVGLSRSVFAERFTHYLGTAPMHYLARWRLQLAARQLERPGLSIAQVAEEAGYESEAAFNRAFKRLMGTPPGAWRRSRAGGGAEEGAAGLRAS